MLIYFLIKEANLLEAKNIRQVLYNYMKVQESKDELKGALPGFWSFFFKSLKETESNTNSKNLNIWLNKIPLKQRGELFNYIQGDYKEDFLRTHDLMLCARTILQTNYFLNKKHLSKEKLYEKTKSFYPSLNLEEYEQIINFLILEENLEVINNLFVLPLKHNFKHFENDFYVAQRVLLYSVLTEENNKGLHEDFVFDLLKFNNIPFYKAKVILSVFKVKGFMITKRRKILLKKVFSLTNNFATKSLCDYLNTLSSSKKFTKNTFAKTENELIKKTKIEVSPEIPLLNLENIKLEGLVYKKRFFQEIFKILRKEQKITLTEIKRIGQELSFNEEETHNVLLTLASLFKVETEKKETTYYLKKDLELIYENIRGDY